MNEHKNVIKINCKSKSIVRPDICHFFSTNVLLGSIFLHMKARKLWQNFPKFLHMWRNFQFSHNCHIWKAEISPHDNFFSTDINRDIRDKYELCLLPNQTVCLLFVYCPRNTGCETYTYGSVILNCSINS